MASSSSSSSQRTPSFKPTALQYKILVGFFLAYGLGFGYYISIQPIYQWRFFSWHPFLMTMGMIVLPGIGAVTKKLGGYTNTKLHAYLGWGSVVCSFLGLYFIYQNKISMGRPHFTTVHAWSGLFVLGNMVALALVGTIFLHPDYGLQKTNTTIRFAHKTYSRLILVLAWITALYGLYQMIPTQTVKLAVVAAPLVCVIPYSLL